MKTLYIIRHAKSSWKNLLLDDFDRPLNTRGKEDIEIIGNELKKKKIELDRIFCSSAKRAKKTCEVICEKTGYSLKKIIFDKNIYDFHMSGIDFYLSYIMEFDNDFKKVALVGHNNALTELACYLLGKDIGNMPTSSVLKIDFDIKKWSDISYGNGNKDFFIYPKMYK